MSLVVCLSVLVLTVISYSQEVEGIKLPYWGSSKEEKHVVFALYTRKTSKEPEQVDSRQLVPFKTLQPSKPAKVLIHGWMGYANCTFYRLMIKGLLQYGDYNVIALDWSPYSSRFNIYPLARSKVNAVAKIVADFLDFNAGTIIFETLHVLGHSLGSHIAGVAGQLITKGKIGRITGFDPAGPQFSLKDKSSRLDKDSADFVDVIHTSAHYLGFGAPIGHVDFYPNGGHPFQASCGIHEFGRCSHRGSH